MPLSSSTNDTVLLAMALLVSVYTELYVHVVWCRGVVVSWCRGVVVLWCLPSLHDPTNVCVVFLVFSVYTGKVAPR